MSKLNLIFVTLLLGLPGAWASADDSAIYKYDFVVVQPDDFAAYPFTDRNDQLDKEASFTNVVQQDKALKAGCLDASISKGRLAGTIAGTEYRAQVVLKVRISDATLGLLKTSLLGVFCKDDSNCYAEHFENRTPLSRVRVLLQYQDASNNTQFTTKYISDIGNLPPLTDACTSRRGYSLVSGAELETKLTTEALEAISGDIAPDKIRSIEIFNQKSGLSLNY